MVTRYEVSDGGFQGTVVLAHEYDALAAENAALKAKAAELVREASTIYTRYNATVDSEGGGWVDCQTLHEMQQLIEGKY